MEATKLWTVEDLTQLPDDDYRYALIRGVLYRMPPPKARHGRVVLAVGAHLYRFVEEHNLGAVYDQSGFILERDPDTLLGPDLSFVQRDRVPVDENAFPDLAPDLVVEIASPSQSGPSLEEKVSIYLAVGVRLIWAIDPARRTVRVYRADGGSLLLTEHDQLDGEGVLPGFQVPIARFFA
jgi:Uma2 family endonuclease